MGPWTEATTTPLDRDNNLKTLLCRIGECLIHSGRPYLRVDCLSWSCSSCTSFMSLSCSEAASALLRYRSETCHVYTAQGVLPEQAEQALVLRNHGNECVTLRALLSGKGG